MNVSCRLRLSGSKEARQGQKRYGEKNKFTRRARKKVKTQCWKEDSKSMYLKTLSTVVKKLHSTLSYKYNKVKCSNISAKI